MRIGIVAGELSGDKLAAELIKAIKSHPDLQSKEVEFVGVGGPAMIAAGCRSLFLQETLSVMGIAEVVKHYPELYRLRKNLVEYFVNNPPDVYIGVDSPGFNLGIEDKLKKAGIKTAHYVSPQVWAWRKWRLKKIAKAVDLMLTVLPFEEDFYRRNGVEARFVGHPRADEIPEQLSQHKARNNLQLSADQRIIAILPGSRANEWRYHVDTFIETAKWCLQKNSDLHFVIALVNDRAQSFFSEHLKLLAPNLPVTLVQGNSIDVITAADVVLAVSGTAALEIMLLKKPMVIAFRMSGFTYQIAKRLVKLPYISLPNLLLDEACIPEFVQEEMQPEKLGAALMNWLDHPEEAKQLHEKFNKIHQQLRCNASEKAADAILELCKS